MSKKPKSKFKWPERVSPELTYTCLPCGGLGVVGSGNWTDHISGRSHLLLVQSFQLNHAIGSVVPGYRTACDGMDFPLVSRPWDVPPYHPQGLR